MRRVVHVTSGKGGVGKSMTSVAMIDHMRNVLKRPLAVYDADGLVGGVARIFCTRDEAGAPLEKQDPLTGVGFYNIRSSERSMLVDCLALGTDLILHDLAGGSLADVCRVMGDDVNMATSVDKLLASYDRRGYRLTLVHVLSPDQAATGSISQHLKLFGSRADHVVVRNLFWGQDFPFWSGFLDSRGAQRGGNTRRQFQELGGLEADLPPLQTVTAAKISSENLPPSRGQDATILSISEQDHCYNYLREVAGTKDSRGLGPLFDLLGASG